MTKKEAVKRLTNRWLEQTEKFPLMARDISLKLYVRRNIKYVLSGHSPLEAYARAIRD